MRAAGRTLLVLLATLVPSAKGSAQTAAPVDPRAQELVSHVAPGHEQEVACERLDAGIAQSLIDIGRQARTESLERQTTIYRLAERAARCAHADALVGAALNAVSDILYGRGQLDAALQAAQESVRIHEGLNEPAGLAEAWNRVGNVHSWTGDYSAAIEAFNRALDHTSDEDEVGRARAWNNIANVEKNVDGGFDKALEHYRRALEVFERRDDRLRTGVVIRNIADVYFRRGEYRTALEHSLRALAMNREIGDRTRLSSTLDLTANIYRALGAYSNALRLLHEALSIRLANDDRLGAMETTHNLGLVYFSQGDYELAIDAYKRSLRLNRQWGLRDAPIVAEALQNVGAAAWHLGQRERAVANFRESLAIAEREHLTANQGAILQDLGRAELENHHTTQALRLLDRALTLRRRIGDQAGITETLTTIAAAKLATGHADAALADAQSAVANATAHDQPELLWNAQTLVGVACRRLGRRQEAEAALAGAVRTIEQLSTEVTVSDNLRQLFFATKLSPYHELIGLLVEERSLDQALAMAERSKARALTRLLQRSPFDEATFLTAAETRERAELRDRVFLLNQRISDRMSREPRDAAAIGKLESDRRAAREALAAFESRTLAAHPELASTRGDVEPIGRSDIERLVDDGTALIEFVVADRRLHAFVVSRTAGHIAVHHHAAPIDSEALANRAERFRKRIASRDFDIVADARALYDTLLAASAAWLTGKTRLVIVPDGPLWNVPFQALRGPSGFLVEQAAVSYAPSLTALRAISHLSRPTGPLTLLAIGKSTFGEPSEAGLEPLSDAVEQVKRLRAVYGPDRTTALTDADASESRVTKAAPDYAVLHVATHAVLDEASPMYSHLVLSPAADTLDDDGRLEAWELMQLKLQADVVVLAACETGRGRIASGEGVIGMMWALFAAGARSVVVSQFRVESQSTSSLLLAFHRRLAAGPGPKAEHLRSAALDLLRNPRYAHPYYWAGFVLVGMAN